MLATADEKVEQIQAEVAKSLALGILCGLKPGGVPYATYLQGCVMLRISLSVCNLWIISTRGSKNKSHI